MAPLTILNVLLTNKGYHRNKTITSQNVSSEAQVNNFFMS